VRRTPCFHFPLQVFKIKITKSSGLALETENHMGEFISKVIKLGFFLAATGQLKPATLYFMHEAAKQHQVGLISLSALNHSLVDRPRHSHPLRHRSR
jgi:hypothetical protein